MPYSCPHCAEAIPDVVPQKTLKDRVKAKNDEISLLKKGLDEAKAGASLVDGLRASLEQAQGELTAVRGQAERVSAYATAGIAGEAVQAGFLAIYQSEQADAEEKKAFGEWLAEDARAHPLLSGHFPAAADAAPAPNGQQPQAPPEQAKSALTPISFDRGQATATTPPHQHRPISPVEVQKYLRSPEFRGLTMEQRRAKIEDIKQQIGGRS